MNQPLRVATSLRGRRIVLASWAAAQFVAPLAAADPAPTPAYTRLSEASERGRTKLETEDPSPIRLNFFNATWPEILDKLAEQSESTLVLHDPPPGRFTRTDLHKYSRTDAVAILNRELEPKGFRILENDKFLIVMSERTMRKQYRPSVLPPEDETGRPLPPKSQPEPEFHGYRRQFDVIRPAGAEQEVPLAEPGQLFPPHPLNAESRATTASGTQVEAEPPGEPVTVSVHVRRGSAAVVAKKVHEAFGARSALADSGPTGLPAFRVSAAEAVDGREVLEHVAFEVEIDTVRDELLVTAPKRSATAIAAVLRDLDRFAGVPGQTLRIAPANEMQMRLAEELEPVLAQVSQNNQVNPNSNAQPGQPNTQPLPNQGQPMGQGTDAGDGRKQAVISGDLPALIGNLRGEVSIEAVPDLGVLIIRGNDQDVQAVRQVIETLENLSAGQQPVIELLQLEHVDSAALATLLESVYGRLATVRNRGTETPSRVAIIPIVKPNAVLVIAPEGEMESVLDLASQLDQPVEPSTEFQVFRLKSALASQVATTIETFYNERAGLGARATVIADVRTNSLIIAARGRDLEEIGALIRKVDRDESALVSQMKVFPLKSAAAEELAEVITTAIQSVINPQAAQQQGNLAGAGAAGGQAAQDLIAARSAVLEFIDASGDAPQLLRSGLLADIRVTPDPRTNALLVAAGEQSLPLIEALIRQLDRPAAAESVVKVFSLENSDATSVVELLDTLFGIEDQGNQNNAAPGIQLAGTGEGSSLIPLKFATDIRTNSVIATGSGDALQVVEAILLRLDESDVRQRSTTVVKLKNAPAIDVATAIQEFLTSQRALIQINENLVSTIELLEREIIVVPEPVSNSLLISATPRYYEEIQRIVSKLDEAPPQVIIQAMLVEVSLDNTDEFGIELGFQDSTLFDRSVGTVNDVLQTVNVTNTSPNGVQTTTNQILSRSATPGFNFNNTQTDLGNNVGVTNPNTIGTQGLSNFSLGRANADLGYGGFVFSASSANVNVLLRALSAKRTIQILSRPQIRTLDNQIAQVQVGQNVPVVTGVSINALQTTPTITRDNAGLILTVTPRISPDGSVVMEVAAERSEYTGAGVPVFVNAATGDTVDAPIKDITTARATVSVPTGQTIVLGGIITRNDDTLERKVPYLGDIPYLGQLFRYDSTRTVRRELLIFLTPRVIYNDADSELIKQVEADRLHFIEQEAEAIHGPLYSIPPAGQVAPGAEVPPVLTPGSDILQGLPADACPPGTYPPGTLFDDPSGMLPADPAYPVPHYDLPPGYAVPSRDVPPGPADQSPYPPTAPPAPDTSSIRPMSGTVATGRLAGRTAPAEPVKKKSLLPSFRK